MGNWRWATWLVVGWSVFMAVILVAIIYPAVPSMPDYEPPASGSAGYQAGFAFGIAALYWLFGMIVLGPIWYFTRKRVMCPMCGNKVSPKAARCGRCGFMPGAAYSQPAYLPPGWPPQAGQPPQAPPPGWPPPPPGPPTEE